jgi:hypothetical protein
MAANPMGDGLILGAPGIEGKTTVVPTHEAVNAFTEEKHRLAVHDGELEKKGVLEPEITPALPSYDSAERDDEDHIIITGADAAAHLLPMRDDLEPALTFRSIFLATILSAFQAVVYQIYQVQTPVRQRLPFANIYLSSNPLWSLSKVLSLFSWPTSSEMHGPSSCPAAKSSKLGGELEVA